MSNVIYKIAAYFVIIVCALSSVALVIIFYLYNFDGNPPIEINNIPIPTNKTVYEAGDDIIIYVEMCRFTDTPFYVSRKHYVNGLLHPTPVETRKAGGDVGCFEGWVFSTRVPPTLPPGEYQLKGQSEYKVNQIAEIRIVPWETETFQVVASE